MRLGAIQGAVANSDTLTERLTPSLGTVRFEQAQIEQSTNRRTIHATIGLLTASGFAGSTQLISTQVTPETELYTIADFIVIMADLFEADIPGRSVSATAAAVTGPPAGEFHGAADFHPAALDPQTTVKVSPALPERRWPVEAGNVCRCRVSPGNHSPMLTVPVDVLDAGQRATALVDRRRLLGAASGGDGRPCWRSPRSPAVSRQASEL